MKKGFVPFLKNELLNFHFSKAEAEEWSATGGPRHRSRGSSFGGSSSSSSSRNRRRCPAACLANHQFRFPGKSQFPVDPDVVEWSSVSSVVICWDGEADGGPPQCAICLDSCDAQSSRVTRCGHVYCWLCLLRHLSFEGVSACPTCLESLFERDLKSVDFRETLAPKAGGEFNFHLCTSESSLLSRYLVESKDDGLARVEAEKSYLQTLQAQCEDPSLSLWERKYEECYSPFIYNALLLLDEERDKKLALPAERTNSGSGGGGGGGGGGSGGGGAKGKDGDPHFFQAGNGDLVFLHPMNRKLLLTCDPVPSSICASVIEVEEMVLSAENRKKIGFLRHFPLNAVVKIVELDLLSILDSSTTAPFLDDMQKRAVRRQAAEKKKGRERAADEQQQQSKILREKQRWAESEARIRELLTGPRVGCEASTSPDLAEVPDSSEEKSSSPPPPTSLLSTIVSRGGHFPTLASSLGGETGPAAGSALPAKDASVWGVTKLAQSASFALAASPSVSSAHSHEKTDEERPKASSGGSSKKGKFKKSPLFSNASARSYS